MKHAYLILAHNSPELLRQLVNSIDDVRNDIFIHIDKKANISEFELSTCFSSLKLIKTRIDGRWGDYSLVEIELLLLEEALKSPHQYQYLHLLSGVDYPIKSQNFIHDFCDQNFGKLFIGFANHTPSSELKWRSQHYFLYSKNFKSKNLVLRSIRYIFAKSQSLVKYKRYRGEIKKGCQWVSITLDFAKYILAQQKFIKKYFKATYCPDEMFIQTLCWNSKYRDLVYDLNNEFNSCKRFIVWNNTVIKAMDNVPASSLINSDKWFARKFTLEGIKNISNIKSILTRDNI